MEHGSDRGDGSDRHNPFPGLRSFEPDEDHLFFGRDRQVDELLTRLGKTRFLAVMGASGSGKSSLVRSGLIPSLYSGYMVKAGSSWRVAIFRPGEDPIGNLAAALTVPEVLGGAAEDPEISRSLLAATLHRSALGLAECVRQARLPEHDCVLVLADQFEELFRFKDNRRIKDSRQAALAFVKLLLEGARQEDVPVYVVLTMRSDFIGNCTEFPGLVEAINEGQYLVPRMTREERRQAIEGPVAVGGGEIAPRLVTRLVNDVGDDPDQLPILQHALMRAWDYWQANGTGGEPLDLRHYDAIGTMKEALSLHAEEAYLEIEGERGRAICERLFKALTDQGSDSRGIRRPVRLEAACEIVGAGAEEVVAVVELFRQGGRTFLMPPHPAPLHADSILDISHESLMRTWRRLIQWVHAEARSSQIYLRLSQNAARYQEGKAALYRDPELQLALNWRDETRPTSAWAQRYDPAFERAMLYLEYSEKERALEEEEKERRRRRQLRRARLLAAVFAVAALVFSFMGLVMMNLKVKADENATAAKRAQEDAESARQEAEENADEARLQARIAEEQRQEAVSAKTEADTQREIAEEQEQRAREERQRAVAQEAEALRQKAEAEVQRQQADEARRDAESQRQQALEAKDRAEISEAEARRLRRVALARALAVQTTRLQAQQAELSGLLALAAYRLNRANGGDPEDPDVYSALRVALDHLDPHRRRILRLNADAVRALAFAADGRAVVAGGDDGAVYLIDPRPGTDPEELAALDAPIRSTAVARDWLAAGAFDGRILVWERSRPSAPPQVLDAGGDSVNALAFGPRDGLLAAGGSDSQVRLWHLENADRPPEVLKAEGKVTSLVFHPRSGRLAAGTESGVAAWDPAAPAPRPAALGFAAKILSLAASADGRWLAVGSDDGTIRLWDWSEAHTTAVGPVLRGHRAGVTALSFAAGRLASASRDGDVRLWDVHRPDAEPIVLPDHTGWVWAVAFAPGGGALVSGGADRTVRFWTTRSAELAAAVCPRVSRDLAPGEWAEYLGEDVEYQEVCP